MRHAIVAIALTVAGMAGLHMGIPYSGWVLFVGLVAAVGAAW